jgi:hypothetical protein
MQDTDWGNRWLHSNSGTMGHLDSSGNWNAYDNNSGQVWTKNYGWLHDYFFSSVSNCSNCGAMPGQSLSGGSRAANTNCFVSGTYLNDNGSSVGVGNYFTAFGINCNCACNC